MYPQWKNNLVILLYPWVTSWIAIKTNHLYCIEIYIDTNLEKPVKWDPEEENVSKELNQSKEAVDHPICKPLCIIFFLATLDSFYSENQINKYVTRAPDKLRICVFYAMKTIKTHVLSDQSVHITHTYCCVSKLSKFGAYLYSRVHNNTFLSLRNSP
jgi:hypothetical protein